MTLAEIIDRCTTQLRLSPLVTDAQLIVYLKQAIQKFGLQSQFLERWSVIVTKADAAKYYLPEGHQVTVAAFYNEVRLEQCTSFDSQLYTPTAVPVITSADGWFLDGFFDDWMLGSGATTTANLLVPTYYYEDEWQDDASTYLSTAFVTQYALLSQFILMWLCKEQRSQGRKTITLVPPPAVDGTTSPLGATVLGGLDGTIDYPTVAWADTLGLVQYAATTQDNLWIIYKHRDILPESVADEIEYNEVLGVAYMVGALSLALNTEADEYDRYRSWLYGQISAGIAGSLRGLAINGGLR